MQIALLKIKIRLKTPKNVPRGTFYFKIALIN